MSTESLSMVYPTGVDPAFGCSCPSWWFDGCRPYCPIHNNGSWTWVGTTTFPKIETQPTRLSDEDVERIAKRVAELVKHVRRRKAKR